MRIKVLSFIPDALLLVGAVMIIHAMFLVATWLGWFVAGVACVGGALLGAAAERRKESGGGR